jgi:hypothetical protein
MCHYYLKNVYIVPYSNLYSYFFVPQSSFPVTPIGVMTPDFEYHWNIVYSRIENKNLFLTDLPS